jgi:hypothetical protein
MSPKSGGRIDKSCQTQRGGSPAENPRGYSPNHATGVRLPDDLLVTPLQYVD